MELVKLQLIIHFVLDQSAEHFLHESIECLLWKHSENHHVTPHPNIFCLSCVSVVRFQHETSSYFSVSAANLGAGGGSGAGASAVSRSRDIYQYIGLSVKNLVPTVSLTRRLPLVEGGASVFSLTSVLA